MMRHKPANPILNFNTMVQRDVVPMKEQDKPVLIKLVKKD
jgi:hypothetical protein